MTIFYNRASEKYKRQALRNARPRAEYILWSKIKNRQLKGYKFRRQYSIGFYVVDFYCPELKLAIELDGDTHLADGVDAYDNERQEFIESFGVKFLRFINPDIYENIEGVLEVIGEYLPTVTFP